MERSPFKVTDKAGHFVAGRRSPGVGETLQLTEEEAEIALNLGELERVDPPAGKSKKAKPDAVEPAA